MKTERPELYTNEPHYRELEKQLKTCCRQVARGEGYCYFPERCRGYWDLHVCHSTTGDMDETRFRRLQRALTNVMGSCRGWL